MNVAPRRATEARRQGAEKSPCLRVFVAYGLAANVCYTAGWMVENVVERMLGRPVYGLGPAMFRYGLVLSVGITLLPVGLVAMVNVLGRLLAP